MIPLCLTLNNIRYVSRLKRNNLWRGLVPSPIPQCSSYWKRSPWLWSPNLLPFYHIAFFHWYAIICWQWHIIIFSFRVLNYYMWSITINFLSVWIAKSKRIVVSLASVIGSGWYLYHFSVFSITYYLHVFQWI